ncbi:ferredoxin [Streptomyces sp. NPDC004539]|uniref:ferredoxin n=1 Tax=Streptomyces sp. NPDC004539 TaxID=3154280 RepID=UPI0033A37EF9
MDQRIDIDWTSCQAHGLCAELLPEHVRLDEWGYPLLRGAPIPESTAKRAKKAAKDCPALALKLKTSHVF